MFHRRPTLAYTIDTAADFVAFQKKEIGFNVTAVDIVQSAHLDLMQTPKLFAEHDNNAIIFIESDFRNNRVEMYTQQRKIFANSYRMGDGLTLGLPHNYSDYHLQFADYAAVSAADLDQIVSWTEAVRLRIDDSCSVALGLLRRAGQLQAMTKLTHLTLNVAKSSLPRMRLRPFFRSLVSLESAEFRFERTLTEGEVAAFLAEQTIPKEFKRVVSASNYVALYRRA